MRIAIICTLYPPYVLGGAEISTSLLAKGLANKGHEVTVITTGNKQKEEIVDGIRVYRVKNKNIYWRYPQRDKHIIRKSIWHLIDIYNIAYKKNIKELLCQIKPDIVHTGNLCGLSTIVWSIAKSLKIPIVHTLRDYYLMCPQQTMMKGTSSCEKQCIICKSYSVIKKNLSQNVDAVIGISKFILDKHLISGYFKESKIREVIPNSVDLKIDTNRRNKNHSIGYIGRLSPEKGLEFMIDAFNASNHYNYKLIIAGDGNKNYANGLKEKYASEDVHFIGKQSIADFLLNIDLLIVPSLWNEPFGRVVIEAYAAHCPVLIAENGGLKELVNKNISYTFNTNNTSSLIELLNNFYKNKLFNNTDFDETFNGILTQYSEERVINDYINIYSKI